MFLILLALLVVPQSSALSELFLPSPSLSPTCSVSNVIDVIQMQCAACVSGTVPVSTTTCGCSNTFIYSDATLSGCMACPSGRVSPKAYSHHVQRLIVAQVASFDRTFCLACPTTINAVTGYCVCGTRQYFRMLPSAALGHQQFNALFLGDTNATGSPAANGVCVDCPVYAYPSSDLSYCQSCPEPTNMVSALVNGVYQCQCMTDRGFERVPVRIFFVLESDVKLTD